MKKTEIIKCLKANKNVDGYELTIKKKDSRELFYVLKHLEINRAVKTEVQTILVYSSDCKGTGSSIVRITAADDQKSLAKKISDAINKAKAAKNQYYPLAAKTKNVVQKATKEFDMNAVASNIAKAVFKADVYKQGWINSTEIFVSCFEKEFVNSNGIDHITHSFKIEIECIPTWSNGKEEFELYKFYESNKIDYKEITSEINEILNLAKDRSCAKKLNEVKLPKKLPVLVKNDMRDLIIDELENDISYRNVFMKQNRYKLKDQMSNNKFELTMKPVIKGCANSSVVDQNGVVLKSKTIIKDGIVKANFGSQQFGYYLKEKNITGSLPVCELKAKGSDYKKKKHLIIETFSSPQFEMNSGYWGGEVRLARYFDGKKYIPLTNLSISGSIIEDMKTIEFSKEQDLSASYKGPKYFIFDNIKVH